MIIILLHDDNRWHNWDTSQSHTLDKNTLGHAHSSKNQSILKNSHSSIFLHYSSILMICLYLQSFHMDGYGWVLVCYHLLVELISMHIVYINHTCKSNSCKSLNVCLMRMYCKDRIEEPHYNLKAFMTFSLKCVFMCIRWKLRQPWR